MQSDTLAEGLANYRIGPKIRALRQHKGLGLAQLGEHSGLSAGMLSRIERGHLIPTLPTLLRIALVFGVGLDHFFAEGGEGPLLEIVRARDRLRLPNATGDAPSFYFESLDFTVPGRSCEAYLAVFPADAPPAVPHDHAGIEMIHVIEGWVELTIHNRTHRLSAGDTVSFDAGFEHSYCGDGRALVTVRSAL